MGQMARKKNESNKILPIILIVLLIYAIWYIFSGTKINELQKIKNLHNQGVIALRICVSSPIKDNSVCPMTSNTLDGTLEFIQNEYYNSPALKETGIIEYKGNIATNTNTDEFQNSELIIKLGNSDDNSCSWTINAKTGGIDKKETKGNFPKELCEK